jgi:hypothetical protein
MSNNFRKYPKTKARRIQGHSSTSLQIQGHSRPFKFCTNPVIMPSSLLHASC